MLFMKVCWISQKWRVKLFKKNIAWTCHHPMMYALVLKWISIVLLLPPILNNAFKYKYCKCKFKIVSNQLLAYLSSANCQCDFCLVFVQLFFTHTKTHFAILKQLQTSTQTLMQTIYEPIKFRNHPFVVLLSRIIL